MAEQVCFVALAAEEATAAEKAAMRFFKVVVEVPIFTLRAIKVFCIMGALKEIRKRGSR